MVHLCLCNRIINVDIRYKNPGMIVVTILSVALTPPLVPWLRYSQLKTVQAK